jgi:hypothetical protein
MMHHEEFGEVPATRFGLRLDKESGKFEVRCFKPETFEKNKETFLSIFRIYDETKMLRRKEKKDFLEGL